jgi:hypothetical protein
MGRAAEREFQARYPTIIRWFVEYDALYLLSYCILYFLSHRDGIDPEVQGTLEVYPHNVEIMQAFALMLPRTFSPKPLLHESIRLKSELKELGELMVQRLFNIPDATTGVEEVEAYRLRTEMMAHTAAVRNWAYHHQMERITVDIAGLISQDFSRIYGVDSGRVAAALFGLGALGTEKLNAHLKKLGAFARKTTARAMVAAYAEAFPNTVPMTPQQADELWNHVGREIEAVRAMLFAHADLSLADVFSFSTADFARLYGDDSKAADLDALLTRLSFSFGDLAEREPEYFILDNPARHRPFIRVAEGRYFTALHGVLPHIALSLVEDLIADDERLRAQYSDRRSAYLESEVERLFRQGFPHATILARGQWKERDSPKTWENDLVVLVDQFALVVESKSGAVTPPARRGAPERLSKTLKALIEEPSEQAQLLIAHLKSATSPVRLTNDQGESLVVDVTQIKYYIPIGVTLEHLGAISSNLKKLRDAGITRKPLDQLVLSLSLGDLECVFDLLGLEAEKIHYLGRRREFERHVTYQGDELDLLAFYLDTGFNIGQAEYDDAIALVLAGKSKELDMYFVGQSEGRLVAKPTPARTRWWSDLLRGLASRTPSGWVAASYALLNMSASDQEKFEREIGKLIRRVRAGKAPHEHNWVAFAAGPPARRFLVAGYPYTAQDPTRRNEMLATIVDGEEVRDYRGAVVIGLDIDNMRYPYSVFAARLQTDLFE